MTRKIDVLTPFIITSKENNFEGFSLIYGPQNDKLRKMGLKFYLYSLDLKTSHIVSPGFKFESPFLIELGLKLF
jgi:hypothetical protein